MEILRLVIVQVPAVVYEKNYQERCRNGRLVKIAFTDFLF